MFAGPESDQEVLIDEIENAKDESNNVIEYV